MIMDYIYGGTVDIHSSVPTFQIKQYDNNSHKLHFKLIDKDNPVSSTVDLTGYTVKAYFRLPNGSDEFVSCEVMEAETGRIAVPFPGSVTQLAGQVSCEIRITGENGYVLSLRKFYFDVLKSIRDDSVIEASEKYSALDDSLLTVGALQNQINALVASPAGSGGDTGTELRDIRIGVDGTEYDSAGEAVRAQITDLHNEVARIDDAIEAVGRTAINSWQGVQAIVRAGLASKVFSVGDQLTCQRDGVDLVWDVIDIDHDTPADPQYIHSLTLQMHDIYKEIQLDAREAFYYAEYGLPAGTYHFLIEEHTWVNSDRGKTVQFTLTDAIPPGGQLVFNQNYNASVIGATLSSYDSATDTRARETVTLIEGDGGTPLGDGKINRTKQTSINSLHRALLGNNNYNESAIRQFLNSNATSGSVWAPQNIWDRPPQWVTGANGFMYGMDADVLAVVGNVTKLTANNLLDGTGTITTTEKFFLPSKEELYAGRENPDFSEGGCYSYYKNYSDFNAASSSSDTNRIKTLNGAAATWVSRNSRVWGANHQPDGYSVKTITPTGDLQHTNFACVNLGIVPVCNIV